MADENGGWKETLLGIAIIVLGIWAASSGVRAVYARFYAPVPGVISLSAYFVDEPGTAVSITPPKSHIKVKGDVSQGGQPVKGGVARVTVSSQDEQFQQSVTITLQNGHFETDDAAFRSIRPLDRIGIKAEITGPGLQEAETIYLNRTPPVDKTTIEYILCAVVLSLIIVFFLAFTGRKTTRKNRTAIIFSYVVIAIFLAVPLLAPTILIRTFPSAVYAMIGAPAGLVNTHTRNQPDNETEWALNIGGFSYDTTVKATVPSKNPKGTAQTEKLVAAPTGSQPGSGTGALPAATIPSPDSGPTSLPNPSTPAETTKADEKATAAAAATAKNSPAFEGESVAPVVDVQGGLVIPLYVIILSVIGGAINMTRKVPGFQEEGEMADFSLGSPFTRVGAYLINSKMGTAVMSLTGAAAAGTPAQVAPDQHEASIEEQAEAIEEQLAPLMTEQIQRNSETDATLAEIRHLASQMQELYRSRKSDGPLLKFNSFEEWAASHPRLGELLRGTWRVELLNQYMYLISAPFLAVVTYYLLDLLGLSKQGVVVVLSFSVGLVSERIVSWILGIATGYLRTDTGKTAI